MLRFSVVVAQSNVLLQRFWVFTPDLTKSLSQVNLCELNAYCREFVNRERKFVTMKHAREGLEWLSTRSMNHS